MQQDCTTSDNNTNNYPITPHFDNSVKVAALHVVYLDCTLARWYIIEYTLEKTSLTTKTLTLSNKPHSGMLNQCYIKTTSEENVLRKNDITTQQTTKQKPSSKMPVNQLCQKEGQKQVLTGAKNLSTNISTIFQSVLKRCWLGDMHSIWSITICFRNPKGKLLVERD